MTTTYGSYYDTLPDGRVLIASPLPSGADETEVRLLWQDQDMMTAEQRKKVFALCGEIAIWSTGSRDEADDIRKLLQADFLRANIERLQMSSISLAASGNCDKGTGSMLIDYLINFCLENSVPTSQPLLEYADDLDAYTYSSLLHRRCLICGRKADIHHVDQVGMGYDRTTKPQLGALVMPLCREHHSEYHSIGRTAFEERYHAKPVPLTKQVAGKYRITGKAAT